LHYDGTDVFLVVKGDLYNCMPDEYKGYNYNIVTAGFKKTKNEVEIDHQYIDKNIIYTFYKIKFNTNIEYYMTVKTPNKEVKDIKYHIHVKDLNWYLGSIDTSGNVVNKSFDINLIKQSAIKYVYTNKIRGKWLNYNNEEITDFSKTLLYKLTMISYINVEDFIKQINDIKKNNDAAMWLNVGRKAPCYLLKENLAKYRRRKNSITPKPIWQRIWAHYPLFRVAEEMNPIMLHSGH
jgi:hypothetical protein